MWLGHFDLSSEDGTPMFRHTLLVRGAGGVSVEQLDDLVEVALGESERFFPAFQFVIWGGKSAAEAAAASLLGLAGAAERKRVVLGKRVSVRVDLGGRRIMTKTRYVFSKTLHKIILAYLST